MGRSEYRALRVRAEGDNMAFRVLLALTIFVALYGCGQVGAHHEHPDKKDGAAPPKNKKATVKEKVGDSAEAELQPANGSGTRGTATFSKADGGVKVVLKVTGLPRSGTMYLAYIHPGTCAVDEGGEEVSGGEHGHSHHEQGATEEIEYPLTPLRPDEKGDGTSTTVVHGVTLEALLSGDPKHVNVHKPGSGEPPPVTCANLNEASPANKHGEREGARQAKTTTPEPSAKTPASGGAPGGISGEEQAAQSAADCRLVLYVANKNMTQKQAEAFSELLTDMIRTMEGPSWTEGDLRNAALDHLAVPRYRECKHRDEGSLENSKGSYLV